MAVPRSKRTLASKSVYTVNRSRKPNILSFQINILGALVGIDELAVVM